VPWTTTHEGRIWLTRERESDTIYAIVSSDVKTGEQWTFATRKSITLKSVRATEKTEVEVLGQSGKIVEYQPHQDPKASWTQDDTGLHISAVRAQRLYDNWTWPFPVVIRITHAKAAE
jgi:alpha-L-fucosidase